MSTYALPTETMLHPVPNPIQLVGAATKLSSSKPQLPTKRKREALCGLGSFTETFAIHPCPESNNDKPVSFKPVRVIGRSQLPLTFLDTSPDDNFTANALFSAHISILEENVESQERHGKTARVLVARHETKRTLYAIERVRARVYSVCRLASWIKEKDVGDLWDPLNLESYPVIPTPKLSEGRERHWWQYAVLQTEPIAPPAKRVRLSMIRKPTVPALSKSDSLPRHDTPADNLADHVESLNTAPTDDPIAEVPSPQEQLESLINQYLEVVYLSKTSLAYFTKGPLTRIRNAFTSPDEGAPPTYDLVAALRSMLLSPKAGEKKYYEKLPTIIKALPPGSFSDDENTIKPKKTKKKLKLSREGVYPHEEMAIRKWWQSDTSLGESGSEETIEQRIKRRIGDLRVRETLTQLILMLEIVALESLSTYKPAAESQVESNEAQAQGDPADKPKKRKRKLEDITVQLDLLLDRLCIWHVTEEAGILDFDSKPAPQVDDVFGSSKRGADRLRDFCVEVIIPFYMNRLPEQALMVNKKLGGPAHTSPPKRKAMKPPAITRKSGEPREPESKKAKRSLTRVATDKGIKTSDRKTPSLSRSATDSTLLGRIKREGSEVPLSAIPFQRSPSKNSRRSMSQFRHLEGRELDLTTPSAAVTAKMKQKQRVEDDLKEAISALKKPNRGLAAGGYVDDIERRGLGTASRSRKPLNPIRKVVKDVQVTATPRLGRRTRDIVDQTPERFQHMSNPFARNDESRSAPSGELYIQSSSGRQPCLVVPGTTQRSATGRNLAPSSVAETPSKAPNSKSFDSGGVRRTIFATPLKPARVMGKSSNATASQLFGSPAQPVRSSPPEHASEAAIVATPMKVVEAPSTVAFSTPKSQPAAEDDIYAALGWNDDDDM